MDVFEESKFSPPASSSETQVKPQKRKSPRRYRRLLLRICVVGFCVNFALMVIPSSLKPYFIRQYWIDYKRLIEVKTKERGFGPYGVVIGSHTILYENNDPAHLDPMRRAWAVAQTRPVPSSTIDTRRLMWDGWGPNCSNTPDGVGIAELGEYVCVPYSAMAIGFAVPLMWWAVCLGIRKWPTNIHPRLRGNRAFSLWSRG